MATKKKTAADKVDPAVAQPIPEVRVLDPLPATEGAPVEPAIAPEPDPAPAEGDDGTAMSGVISTSRAKGVVEQKSDVENPTALQAKATLLEAPKKTVLYVASKKESAVPIQVNGKTYNPMWQQDLAVWTVDEGDVEMFDAHMLVQHGRVVKTLGKK